MPMINIEDTYILGETGAQVDKVTGLYFKNENASDTEKAQARANIGAGGSNRNLLDNPWFTVNQREKSSYNSAGYSVDRWLSNGTQQVTVSSAGVTLGEQGYRFVQRMKNPAIFAGETLTISAKTNAANVRFAYWDSASDYSNGTAIAVPVVNGYASLTFNITNGIYAIGLSTASGTGGLYRAMKLEYGSVSTLPNDAPPNYAEELRKCQYYFVRLHETANYGYFPVGFGAEQASSAIRMAIMTPTSLRRAPVTVSFSGTLNITGNGTRTTVTSMSILDVSDTAVLASVVPASMPANQHTYTLSFGAQAYIDISAEL